MEDRIYVKDEKPLRFFFSFTHFYKILLGLIAYHTPFPMLNAFIHRLRGVKIRKLTNVFIGYHVMIDSINPEYVEIEDEVWIARNVMIATHFNPTPTIKEVLGTGRYVKKVTIGKGTMILIGAIILPGVRIGKGAIVGAGAVVARDVPDYSWVAGNPARVIKSFKKPSEIKEGR